MNLKPLLEPLRGPGFLAELLYRDGGSVSFKNDGLLCLVQWEAGHREPVGEDCACFALEELRNVDARPAGTTSRRGRTLPGPPPDPARRRLLDGLADPFLEALLHAAIPQAHVVRSYSPLLNAPACAAGGQRAVESLFGAEALWLPHPASLQEAILFGTTIRERAEQGGRLPGLLFVQNLGCFLAAADPEALETEARRAVDRLKDSLAGGADLSPFAFDRRRAAELAPALRMLLRLPQRGSIVVFHTDRALATQLADPEGFRRLSLALTPEQAVFCAPEPLRVAFRKDTQEQLAALEEELSVYRRTRGCPPRLIGLEGLGVFAWGVSKEEADRCLHHFLAAFRTGLLAQGLGGTHPLSGDRIEELRARRSEPAGRPEAAGPVEPVGAEQAGAAALGGRLQGRIALVTGAAQGIGRGIAEFLAREGAHTAFADLNAEGAASAAQDCARACGYGRALGLKVDVTAEESVQEMVQQTVLAYGGLDIFVNNAGVLRAGGLEEMDPQTFALVTQVNYSAFFLCTRSASRPMKVQHRYAPDHFMDIVLINSKSGLEGSNRNFAYAGSKFGGLGLTQSFALELAEHHIKVNAVCPGNFLEGPLWSDPRQGLFVQYLRSGKVPGARTVEEVRRFYEAKVPLKRGCRLQDINRAVLYLIEQCYETGQALPVTGGQVMLK